ncbi:MAG: Mur ligase family protein, partial [Bacteriovorax sp.]|nr:Mur ligase family protein [Bacteriovorax sp.]
MLSSKLLALIPSKTKTFGPNGDFKLIINTDSRSFKKAETFVALSGDNFDGFNYVEQVARAGASAIIYSQKDGRDEIIQSFLVKYPNTLFVETIDALKCIQQLAELSILDWRSKKSDRKIIGITGSNGKTTHKEMIFSLLNTLMPNQVLATKGNLNNHIGVPLTIFGLEEKHEVAIIEMGMNHPGEIQELCSIAHPEHGMITNIGSAHIEFMNSMDNIFKEKASLYQAILENAKGNGMFVVNADDVYLIQLEKSKGLTTYGESFGDIKIQIKSNSYDQQISFNINGQKVLITNNNILEHHNLKNLAGTAILV